ncbi:hypothetical protein EDD99_6027 [Streptomyces sp. 846.5]|nr:hypothetical protein [Streptomyces sp. 846.5]TDT97834.1 hypothetical protein EDD99_6027 [Streptomyces sp. 846.5]
MSIELPSWLAWVATLAVGQHWPKGDEDGLRVLGEAWEEAAQQLVAIGEEIGPATQGVLSNIGGSVANEFKSFVTQLQSNLPDMAQAAGQMGTLGKETGVQVEYAKYMILAQLAWLAVEIVDLSWWAPEAVPAAITAARVAVWMILRRLLTSIASGIGFMVGMDALIQAIQLLKGDRTHWDWQSTLSAVESGAIAGAIGGIIGEGAGHIAPGLAKNIIGKGIIGGATGVASSAALTGIFGGTNNFGEAFAGGAIGSMLGGGGRKGGEGAHVPKEDIPDIHVPTGIDLHLPDVNGIKPPAITIEHTPTTASSGAATGSATRAGTNVGEAVPHTTQTQTSAAVSAPSPAPHVVETAPAHNSTGLPGFETTLAAQTSPSSRPETTTTSQQRSAPAEAAPRAPRAPVTTPTEAPHIEQSALPAPSTSAPHEPTTAPMVSPTSQQHIPTETQSAVEPVNHPGAPTHEAAPSHDVPVVPTSVEQQHAPGLPAEGTAPAIVRPASAPPVLGTERPTALPPTESSTPSPTAASHPTTTEPTTAPTTAGRPTIETAPTRETVAPVTAGPTGIVHTEPSPSASTPTTATVTASSEGHTPEPAPRTPPPRMTLDRTPRFVVRSGFDQRDFTHNDTPYTDLTVRIAFQGGDPKDYAGTFGLAKQGVEQYYNDPKYRLPNGSNLHVTIEAVQPHEQPHLTVTLVGQDHGMDQRSWPPHASPISYAHEIGHQLGLRDEYQDSSNPNRAHVPGSLLGDYHNPSEHGLPQGGLGGRHLQLLNALTGGGTPAHPQSAHHPVGPAGSDEVTPRMPGGASQSASLHDHVPQSEWWKLYIDPKNHAVAVERFPENPGSFYDHDRSPGYQEGMVSAYTQFLGDPKGAHTPLNADSYQAIHDLAVSNLGRDIGWSGGRPTHFPLRGMQLAPDIFHETVGGRPLVHDLATHDWSKPLTGPKPITITTNAIFNNHSISTNYGKGQAPGLVNDVFQRHYDTVGRPGIDTGGKLGSIASTIRALHVIHPFEDGNLRTNVQIVLPKLLLEQGFRPIVPDDMYTIFQGGHSVDQMVESLVRNSAAEGLPHTGTAAPSLSVAPKAPVRPPDRVSPAEASDLYGMPKGNFTKFQQIAQQKNLVIDVRPTNPQSVKWLDQGMLPKPVDIKAKTVNSLDTHLGANPDHQGLVGYFRPTMPTERPPGMDDGTWNSLQQRYDQRAHEFEQLAPKMQKLAASDTFHVEDGLVKGYNSDGQLTAITGDHDIFDITTPGGHTLTPTTYQQTIDHMIANNMAVAHGAHTYWPEPRSPFSQKIYEKIVTSHAEPNGEPLVRFRPGPSEHPGAELAWSRPDAGAPSNATAAPHTDSGHQQPSWQDTRDRTTPIVRQHAWVDPVSDPTRTIAPEPVTHLPTEPTHTEPTPVETPLPTEPHRPTEPEPAPAPAPPPADARHQRSLAGMKITEAPEPDAVRTYINTLLGDHRNEQQVQQRLDVQLDPSNFRSQHPQMVDGGWRFPISVGGKPHEVQLDATPSPWRGTAGTAKDSTDIEASSSSTYAPEPRKVDSTSAESGLDLAPSGFIPVNPKLNALVTGSLSVGGVSHGANTTVKSSTEAPNKVTLTGPTDNHTSTFTYRVRIVDDTGTPLPHPGTAPPLTGEVKADIPRSNPVTADGPHTWNGWDTAPGAHPDGRPLTVTGLGEVRDAVFQHLPEEQHPEGLAHQPILDFLDPKNVVNGFEHASSWGLDSPEMTFSDGRTGYLRLTLHPQDSTIVDTVDHKSSLGAKSTTEYSGSRADSSSRALGANGGASGEVWASAHDKETKWLTGTAGYNYAASTAHQAKQSSTLTAQSSHEQSGTSHLVATRVHFQVEVIKNHISLGSDGTHDTRSRTIGLRDPLPRPEPNADHVAITMEHPISGEALRLVPPAPATHAAHEQPAPQPPTSADLRTPLAAQRTSFLDVPGSSELEQHIVAQLHQQAPGLLPPPANATGGPHRVTPQAVENLRTLHQQLSPSALRGGGSKLLDGDYTISLDTSHLPGFPSRTYDITVHAELDHAHAAHLGNSPSTGKAGLGLKTGSDRQIGHGGKHTVSLAGNLRSSLNPPDTGRAFLNANADGSYSSTHQVSTGADSEVKREFTLESPADSFSYPVSYQVRIGPQGGTHAPTTVHPANGRHLVAEVRPPANPDTPPPTHLPLTELPPAHLVSHVGNEDAFRQQAQTALTSAYQAKGGSRPPGLSTALDSLTGPHQLRGQVSASHNSWSNTGTEHVGSGRNPDAVGLSTRTTLSDFTYRETLPGQGKLSVEVTSGSSTTVVDKWSGGIKGGLGPDFVRYPENPQGLHESTYQVRGGFKGKLSLGRDGNDSVKTQVSTSHKTTTPQGTWHVYEANARVTTTGRVVDANGATHYGRPQQSDHPVLVLLSDEDVRQLTAPGPDPQPHPDPAAPPHLWAHLLDQGLPAGTVVNFHNTDGILHEIDAQLRGPQPNGEVPVRALPFADTFSPDNLSAHYSDLVGKGILDYHVQEGRAGRTVTEVLVRGIPREEHWQDDGRGSAADVTRTVTSSRTVKGNSGSSWSAGADANASASVRTPKAVAHLSNANYGPSAGGELGRTGGAESGVTAKTEQKTAKFGPGLGFSNGMDFSVVVTQRTEYGRFVNLPKVPGTVPHPGRVTAWVPESMTRPADAPPLGAAHHTPADVGAPDAGVAGGIPLHQIAVPGHGDPATDPLHWQQQLSSGHAVVGFDRAETLLDNAGTALNTPRPWSDTFLGRAGQTGATILGAGTGLIGGAVSSGAHAVLPKAMTDMAHRVVTSFVADPRLNTHPLGADVQHEQRLPLDQRLGVRQVFSSQSLPSVLQQAKNTGTHYETVPLGTDGKTALQVSVTPTGLAEEVGTRPNGEDETTVTMADASGTSATSTHSWSAAPANFSLTTNKPVVTIPFNGPKLTGEGSSDRTVPVTRTPGQPSRPQPPAALPHGLTPGEPGKAELKGPQSLLRQPVRVTIQKTDATGPYGATVPTDGHLYYWAAKPAAADTTGTAPQNPLGPISEHVISFTGSHQPDLSPAQLTELDDTAARLAALNALRFEGEPPPAVTVNTFAAVQQNGVRHYGQSLSLATQRARSVAEALRAALAATGTDVPITLAPHVSGHPEEDGNDRAVLVVTGWRTATG